MAILNSPQTFTIKCTGEVTSEEYLGTFKAKPFLSQNEQMLKDQLRREYIGTISPDSASPRAQNQAFVLSEIQARIVESPSWWKDSRNGLDLLDDAPIGELFNAIQKIVDDATAEIKKKAEKSKEELKKSVSTEVKE